MLDILLVNGTVITVDGENRVFERGYVAVKDGLIAGVGSMEELDTSALPEANRVMDMAGHAVLPGLVDAHGHGGHCLLKTLGEHYDDEWNEMAVHAYYRCTDTDFWYNEGALAAAERIKFGTTPAVSMVGSDPKIDSVAAVDANLAASCVVQYDIPCKRLPTTLRYQVDSPLLGVMFSPQYGQSYYEIFSLGHSEGTLLLTSLHRQPSLRHWLTADMQFRPFTLRMGYMADMQQSRVNGLRSHDYSHSFLIGFVREFTFQ